MKLLKQILLIIIGSLTINSNYAQCPIGETEITIQFIEEGFYPDEVRDYKIQGVLSESGPYNISDIITTCVPLGNLTIIGCDSFGDTWNGAIFQVTLPNDTTSTTCPFQNGCYIYTSTIEDAINVPVCSADSEYEVANINIGTCEETSVIITGCTNPLALNYSECAISDDGSCKVASANNNCEDAELITVSANMTCETSSHTISGFKYNNLGLVPDCSEDAEIDAFYEFVVSQNTSIKISSSGVVGLSLYNTCSDEPLFCKNNVSNSVFANLNPDDTMLLQVFSDNTEANEISICIEEAIPSVNNTCGNATLINIQDEVSCGEQSVSFTNIYNGANITSMCNENNYADAFYNFIVPSSGQVRLTALTPTLTLGFALYENCSNDPLVCSDEYNIIFKQLTPNDTMLLQVFSDFSPEVLFCLENAVQTQNSDCSNAKFIEVATIGNFTDVSDTISLANNALDIQPTCDQAEQDAFYQFIVPTSGEVLISSSERVGMALFNSCDQSSFFCETNNYEFKVDNLTPGDTLVLQIFDDNSNGNIIFQLIEIAPTANNECINAQHLEVVPLGECSSNLIELNLDFNTLDKMPDCSGYAFGDAYYKFVVPNSGSIKYSSNGNIYSLSLYNACTGSSIFCKEFVYEEIISSLTPGDTLILQIFTQFEDEVQSFCIEEIIPSVNNNCAGAIPIVVAENGNCLGYQVNHSNLEFNTADIQPDCNDEILHDLYYKFEVPPTGQILFSSGYELGIAIYNSCDDIAVYCKNNVQNESISNLPIGDTVILQVFEDYSLADFSFCLEEIEPSMNNNCVDAIPVTVAEAGNCESNIVELSNLYYNSPDIQPECDDQIQYDAFYQFVVPPSGQVWFSSNEYIGMSVYSSCENNSIFCNDKTSFEVIRNLPIGDTLVLQIFDYYYKSDFNFSFCLEEATPTINNNCTDATPIAVAERGMCESNIIVLSDLYYNSANIQPECSESIQFDAFYEFVVPQSGQVSFSPSYNGVSLAIYQACNESVLMCGTVYENIIIRDLPKGGTLILHIFESYLQDDVSFCLEDALPAVNENCIDALPIEVSQPGNCEMQTVDLYYNTADVQADCVYEKVNDAFYEFVVPESGNIIFSSDQYPGISILNSCDGKSIFCTYNTSNEVIRNLPVGETVILQIFSYYSSPTVSFCIEAINPSINNNCASALPITIAQPDNCETHQVNLSNFHFNSLNKQPFCNTDALYDAFYQFTIPPSGQIQLSFNYQMGISIYSSCDGQLLYCASSGQDRIIRDLPPGENVILQTFGYSYPTDLSFCLKEIEKSINNNCVDATPIVVAESGNCNAFSVSVANLNYNSANIEPACNNNISYDAFYEFVVPETGQVSFSTDNQVGISIYQACNGNSLFCEDYAGNEFIRNLPAGETVILQIFEDYDQPDFTFCLEEFLPALNNLCINAEPFIVSEPGNCEGNYVQVLNTSNNSDINPYCASYVLADAFYSFIVPASGHITISTTKEVGISIYDDCLEQSFYCSSSFRDKVVYGLIPGDTLILQAFQTNDPSDFELCLEDAPPSENNNCDNAEALQVNEEGTCEGNLITALNKNNSVNINPSCEYISADIFYKLTVPENGQFRIIKDNVNSIGLSIYTACNKNAIYCKDFINTSHLIQGLLPNEEVILQFFQDGNPSDFELCLEKAIPTPNNNCSNATPIDVAPANDIFERTNTLDVINNSINIAPSCYSASHDAFYEFRVPDNGKIAINSGGDFGIALYKDCDSSNEFCNYYINNIEIISGLPAGEMMILQFFNRNNYQYSFEFSISEVMDNNTCENATLLCGSTINGTNLFTSQEESFAGLICNYSYEYINNTAWYSFNTNETGNQVSFEITKGTCYDFAYINAYILSGSCDSEPMPEDCIEIRDAGDLATLTLENPVANQQYYLVVASDYENDYCNFEINVVEGVKLDCCQFDYSLDAWCDNNNPENYFVDITINDFGSNTSGYRVVGTNNRVTSADSTITIGPIPSGTNTITLLDLDQQNCITTETIDFNCIECDEHILHNNAQVKRNHEFNASKTIESGIKVMPSATIKYSAGDSIILKQGFTVEKGADFSIDIDNCE